jgi:phenylpropionate dioxygenase-like ring-hydroxylating dioxygenase large terminal subunit
MGNLMRQFWIPALKSTELPSPDCPPIRTRLLGENLIGFRATSGAVGLIANSCPHRGASLFFGRNEEEGLRCVYHGWKFDVDGNCVDMPSEPAESNFKNKVKAATYPCIERKGVIWTYMGPRETPPPMPHIESNMVENAEQGNISKTMRDCNYMQALEGDIDTSHLGFLHQGALKWQDQPVGSQTYYVVKDRAPRYLVRETDFGVAYGAYRPTDEGDKMYWRLAYFLFPFYTMIPTDVLGEAIRIRAWVPIDTEHTMVWSMNAPRVPSATQGGFFGTAFGEGRGQNQGGRQGRAEGGPNGNDYLPDTSDWLGKWRIVANKENDYLIDREAQANNVSFTGINGGRNGVFLEDQCVTESMGQVYDRSREHLGTSDSMVIRTRRRLLNAAKAFRDEGLLPEAVDSPEVVAVRSGGVLLPRGVDWWEGTAELRKAFVEHKAEGPVPMQIS